MNRSTLSRLLLILLVASFSLSSCNALFTRSVFRGTEKQMSGPKRSSKGAGESRKVRSTIKKQEKKQAKLKRDYHDFVKLSRKRSYEIQSPEVKARMKQNEANIAARDKAKDKTTKKASRNRARKFR